MNELYKDKYFYEIVKIENSRVELFGPRDNIFFTKTLDPEEENLYPYVQIINRRAVQAFTDKQILVTNRIL